MSKDKDEIDWDKVLKGNDPIPEEIPKEKVLVAFERMRDAQRYSRLNYVGAAAALCLIFIELYVAEMSGFNAKVTLVALVLGVLQIHYIYLIAALQRIRTGRTK